MDAGSAGTERQNPAVGLHSGSTAESLVNDILECGGWQHAGADETRHGVADRNLCGTIDAEAVGDGGGCQFRTVGDSFEALAGLLRELTLGV